MNRKIEYWTVQKLLNMLSDGKLNYKPSIQRQFVYSIVQQQQVIMSIKKGFIASSLVVEKCNDNEYILLDGKQRINSIIGFVNHAFDVEGIYFEDIYRLDRVDRADRYKSPKVVNDALDENDNSGAATLLKFTFPIVLYSDMTNEERLTLFNVINTTGVPLNVWELVNGRYPTGVLVDMRINYFNERVSTNTVTLDSTFNRVKKFEKYFGTHEVNRGELYQKIIEKLFVMYGGNLDDRPYEIVDGIQINQKNYNKLCRFVEAHLLERFEDFAKILIDKIDLFYEMFKDINNLGVLKEICFNIDEIDFFKLHKDEFLNSESKKTNLHFLISQYINSDLKSIMENHKKYFEEVILPSAYLLKDDFRTHLDTKRFYTKEDKERIFIANDSFDSATMQVRCHGVMDDGVTECGCGRMITKNEATVDHIIPWIMGGRTDDSNAQILCRECNSSKGSRIISTLLSGAKDQNE